MSRDRRMREGSSIAATKASAVNCPTPGIVISRRQAAEAGTVRNLVCGAIVTPMEGAYGNQERDPGRFAGGA